MPNNNDDDDCDCRESACEIAAAVYAAISESHISDKEPKMLQEAKRSPEWLKWEKAIQTELDTLEWMGTWELAYAPEDRKPVTNKWVFIKKYNKNGNLQKYKAHLVARKFIQVPGMDDNETFLLRVA